MKGKYKTFILMLLVLTSNLALAQANLFEPSKDDVMIKIISQIFGSITPNGGKDAFGSAIEKFNGAMLMIGGILYCYTLISSIINTAQDGEMLGKKFSSAWIPIRYTLGTAMILPVFHGYAVIQKLLMWVIIQGIALGGMIWSAYMEIPYQQANTTIQETTKYDVLNIAEKVFLSQVCVQSNQNSVKRSDSILDLVNKYNYTVAFDSETNTYNFGDQNGSILGAGSDVCGSIKLADPVANQTVAKGPATTNNGYLGPLDDLFSPADISPINKAHEKATKELIASMGKLATDLLNDKGSVIDNEKAKSYYQKIKIASNSYITTIKASADSVQTQKAVSDKAKDYGFAMAGSYFMNIIVTNNKITTALANTPVASPKFHTRSSDVDSDIALGTRIVATGNNAYGSGAQATTQQADQKDVDLSWDGKLVNAITKYFTHLDFYNLKNDPRHPIIILSDMGNTLSDAYIHLVMAVLGIAVAGGAVGAIVGTVSPMGAVITSTIGNGLTAILGFLALPLMLLIGSAFTASYLIPMMVFIMWIGILVGYSLAVVMGVVVAPLWAVMHLYPDGHDVAGKGASGYLMVLNLLLKPAFMIFGLISAIVLSSVIGEFINKAYFQTFSFSQGDGNGLMGFIKVAFGTAIYIGLMFMFIKKCFGIIGLFSDEIFRWIGGHNDNIGSHAEHMQQGSTGAFNQAATFLGAKGLHDKLTGTSKKFSEMVKENALNKMKDKGNNNEPAITDPRQRFANRANNGNSNGTITPKQSYSDFRNSQPGTPPGTDSTGGEQSITETPRDSIGAEHHQQEQSLGDAHSSGASTASTSHPSFSDVSANRTEMATPTPDASFQSNAVVQDHGHTTETGRTIQSDAGFHDAQGSHQQEPSKAPETSSFNSNATFNDASVDKQQEQPKDSDFKGE